MKKHKVRISTKVSKLGKDIHAVSLPVGKTCRPDAPCFSKCYARKGKLNFKDAREMYQNNLEAYLEDPAFFFDCIIAETKLSRFFRWHVAGDIVDIAYLSGMCKVARVNKDTKYLAFTKRFDFVNEYISQGHKIPRNLTIVFSGWGAKFEVLNPHNFPIAHCLLKGEDPSYIPEGSIPCGGKCYECLACWQLKKGQSVYFEEH